MRALTIDGGPLLTDSAISNERHPSSSPLALPEDACHLWSVDLTRAATPPLLAMLDSAEHARAARFRFEQDRARFLLSRAALRATLATYLECEPQTLRFAAGEHGRPYLIGAPSIEFNLSHSGDLALIAVAAHAPLGVDVEQPREVPRALELARRYFHPEELQAVADAASDARSAVFLTCWTRKEAVLKSIGAGLTRDTRALNVGASAREELIQLANFPPLRLTSLTAPNGYPAACATAPHVRRIELCRWAP